jgi:hypothetical protein
MTEINNEDSIKLIHLMLKDIFEKEKYNILFENISINFPNHNGKLTLIVNISDYTFMLKVYAPGAISCNIDRPNGKDSPYIESSIMNILNEEFFNLTPCIPKLFYVHKMSKQEVKKNIKSIQECIQLNKSKKDCDIMCKLWDEINNGFAEGEPTFLFMEDGHLSFNDYCANASTHIEVWIIKTIIWLVVYTLDIITKKYPKFVHGDLFARNIILYMDSDFLKKDRLGEEVYINIGGYFIPYMGIIPKIIDYELSVLNDEYESKYQLSKNSIDLVQLMYSIRSIFRYENQITQMIDKLTGIKTDLDLNYFQYADVIQKNGGLPSYQTILSSDLFGYKKDKIVDPENIWGVW